MVACCERYTKLGNVEIEQRREFRFSARQKEKIRPVLNEGLDGQYVPIPSFRNYIPNMVANLKRLELLDRDKIYVETNDENTRDEGKFRRIASTDSPFRELVAWAYLRVTGRPGMPNFNVESWLCDIETHFGSIE